MKIKKEFIILGVLAFITTLFLMSFNANGVILQMSIFDNISLLNNDVSLCNRPGSADILQIIGYILLVIKIVVPIIIIILSIVSISKCVISADEKDTKDAIGIFIKRIIAGLLIFFIPTIVGAVFNIIGEYNQKYKNDFSNCVNCLVNPSTKCNKNASGTIFE